MISEGVEVSVETYYQQDYSNPMQSEYMFAYRIAIENHNSFPVKLHRRHWHIFDSNGQNREVDGEGVVGVQPTLNPGEKYDTSQNRRNADGHIFGDPKLVDQDRNQRDDAETGSEQTDINRNAQWFDRKIQKHV